MTTAGVRIPMVLILCSALAGSAFAARPLNARAHESSARATGAGEHARTLLEFDSMYGVDGPFVGEANPIRGIPGDELPWTVESAKGRLDTDGHLTVTIRGLVFTDDPEVPPELQGINDEDTFRAVVSCLTEDGDAVVERNVFTAPFPATPEGDSKIKTTVELPQPCVAPTVLILAGSEDKWFAVVGFEEEEEGE
jgi:hypothetical protein